ncbi:MAG: OsmC family protein [Xanthomonadaceae bacterium]|nr:OsmC family protein [Xanthomonadaceae bacterium]
MAGKKIEAEIKIRTPGKYTFDVKAEDHTLVLDAGGVPGHTPLGMSPKQVLIGAILSCSAMDVVAWLGKRKVSYSSFRAYGESELTDHQPKVFSELNVVYELAGVEASEENLNHIREAVDLSMTKYCGVSAMVSKTVPIFYTVRINGEIEHRSQAKFF